MSLYKEMMIKVGSHAEKISACKTRNHSDRLTRPLSELGSGARDYLAPQ